MRPRIVFVRSSNTLAPDSAFMLAKLIARSKFAFSNLMSRPRVLVLALFVVCTTEAYPQAQPTARLPERAIPASNITATNVTRQAVPLPPTGGTIPRQSSTGVTRVVFEGDSMTSGAAWTDGLFGAFPGAVKINVAAPGDIASNMVSTFESQIAPLAPVSGQTSWLILMAGVNDLYSKGASHVYQSLKTIWALGRARGFRVCAATLADSRFLSGFDPASQRGELAKLNFLIRQDPSLYDALLPVNEWFPDATDLNLFSPDQLHMSPAGSLLFGRLAFGLFTSNPTAASTLTSETVNSIVWKDNLKRITAEYANTFQPMDLDRFTQISTGSGTTFTPAYYGDYLVSVSNAPGNSGGVTARYPTITSANNIQWNTHMSRGMMLHSRHSFGLGTEGIARVLVGAGIDTISGPLDRTGFGFECIESNNTAQIRAVAHDGNLLKSGQWVTRNSGNTQWFALCSNGTVTLWERYNIGADWSDWKLLQILTGGPTVQNGTNSEMVRINAEAGQSASVGVISMDLIQVVLTVGLDRPYDLWAR